MQQFRSLFYYSVVQTYYMCKSNVVVDHNVCYVKLCYFYISATFYTYKSELLDRS